MRFFRFGLDQVGQALAPGRSPVIGSPWAAANTLQVIAADVFGAAGDLMPVTRTEAMRIPAVVAARNLVCGTLAKGVLRAFTDDTETETPRWCYRTDSDLAPQLRMLWTFDDLFFGGYSLWWTYRTGGQITDAVRVPPERWSFGPDMNVLVDDAPVSADEVVLFVGWDEGLLLTGESYIRGARELHSVVRGRVRTPVPHTVLHPEDPTVDPTQAEITKILTDYVAARRSRDGAVSWLPYGIATKDQSATEVALYEGARNAEALDFARLTGVPAAMLEATGTSASLTYETRETSRAILMDRLQDRANVVDARLSMDDVCAPGQRIALDLSALTTGPDTGQPAPSKD